MSLINYTDRGLPEFVYPARNGHYFRKKGKTGKIACTIES